MTIEQPISNLENVLALQLNEFIRNFELQGWQMGVKVKDIDFCPQFLPDDIKSLLELKNAGKLETDIDVFFEKFRNGKYKDKWYVMRIQEVNSPPLLFSK